MYAEIMFPYKAQQNWKALEWDVFKYWLQPFMVLWTWASHLTSASQTVKWEKKKANFMMVLGGWNQIHMAQCLVEHTGPHSTW